MWQQGAAGEEQSAKIQRRTGKTGREVVNIKTESARYHKRGANKGMWEFRGRLQPNLAEPLVSHL